jgi:hypothetical protein
VPICNGFFWDMVCEGVLQISPLNHGTRFSTIQKLFQKLQKHLALGSLGYKGLKLHVQYMHDFFYKKNYYINTH